MSIYAVVDDSTNVVALRLVLDSASDYMPSAGFSMVEETTEAFNVGGTLVNGVYTVPSVTAAPVTSILSQDLMAQFTPADISAIQTAISGNAQLMLLWYSLLAQRDPMSVGSGRFKAGWTGLKSVLGPDRMNAVAARLGINFPAA